MSEVPSVRQPATRVPVCCPMVVLAGLVAFAALTRLLPHHIPNLSAVAATALFAGWYFRNRLVAMAAPLGAMLISDSVIGGYHPAVMVVVYASLLAPVMFGRLLGGGAGLKRLFGGAVLGSLAASVLFFLTTNLAVWAFSGYYAKDAAGLGECFGAAVPFFRFTAGGDLVFTLFLFGLFALITRTAGRVVAGDAQVAAA